MKGCDVLSNVILVTSNNKESGKSIISLKTAIEIANTNENIVIVDIFYGIRSISKYANVEDQIIYDVQDVMNDTCSYTQATIEINNNLHIIPAPRLKEKGNNISQSQFSILIEKLRNIYKYIIIDGSNMSNNSFINYDLIDNVLVIDNSDICIVRNIFKIINLLKEDTNKSVYMLINKYNKESVKHGTAFPYKDLIDLLPVDIVGVIKYDPKLVDEECNVLLNNKEMDEITKRLAIKLLQNKGQDI